MSFRRNHIIKLMILVAFSVASSQAALAETWKIITLDWPPYTDEKLPHKGAGAKALSEAMKSVGIDVEFVFMPWSRGAHELKKSEYVGIFPTWTEKILEGSKLSPPIFESPIGFVFHRTSPRTWNSLQDFKGLRMGVVQDYNYPEEVHRLAKSGVYSLHTVNTDEQNLFKVAYKRIDLTIADLVNTRYLIEFRNPELKNLLLVDPKVYKSADLFIAFKNDAHFNARSLKVKQALQKVSAQKIVDREVKQILKQP